MTQSIDFEQSMKALEAIVEQLEKGELSLEKSLEKFEQGMQLAQTCQQTLAQAEQKVELLTSQSIKVSSTLDESSLE